jgi:exodeoxyribonuclease VII large subunit
MLLLERKRARIVSAHERLRRAPALLVERSRATVEGLAGRLRTLSPAGTLDRGYAIVRARGAVVRSASALAPGEHVDVRVASGSFGARVERIEP